MPPPGFLESRTNTESRSATSTHSPSLVQELFRQTNSERSWMHPPITRTVVMPAYPFIRPTSECKGCPTVCLPVSQSAPSSSSATFRIKAIESRTVSASSEIVSNASRYSETMSVSRVKVVRVWIDDAPSR